MKLPLFIFSALFVLSVSGFADKQVYRTTPDYSGDKKAVPGIGDTIYVKREDVKTNNYIGETEKNLVKGWGTGKGDVKTKMEASEKALTNKELLPSR